MREYFSSTGNTGGMIREGQVGTGKVFSKMKSIHKQSFQDLGGEYIERGGDEKTCAIRLASTVFFEVVPGFGLV